MVFQKKTIAIACSFVLACMGSAHADQTSDLQAQLDALQKQIKELQTQIDSIQKKQEQVSAAPGAAAPSAAAPGNYMKPGNALIFQVGGGEVQLYGHVDVSLDYQTNGMSGFINNGLPVTGNNSWVADISSNLSYFGIRGQRPLSDDLKAVFQLEGEIAYAATPGASDQATDTTAQKYALGWL